jgi:hypothetical protein
MYLQILDARMSFPEVIDALPIVTLSFEQVFALLAPQASQHDSFVAPGLTTLDGDEESEDEAEALARWIN